MGFDFILRILVLGMGVSAVCFSKVFAQKINQAWQTSLGLKIPILLTQIFFILGGLVLTIISSRSLLE